MISFMLYAAIYSLFSLSMNRIHLLTSLITLELFTLIMSVSGPLSMLSSNLGMVMTILFLTLGACEASLGLAMLVSLVKLSGNDLLKSVGTT